MGFNRAKALACRPKQQEPRKANLINKTAGRVAEDKQSIKEVDRNQSICRTQIYLSRPKTGTGLVDVDESTTIKKN